MTQPPNTDKGIDVGALMAEINIRREGKRRWADHHEKRRLYFDPADSVAAGKLEELNQAIKFDTQIIDAIEQLQSEKLEMARRIEELTQDRDSWRRVSEQLQGQINEIDANMPEPAVIEGVTRAIIFEDCGCCCEQDIEDNLNLGIAAVKAMRQHIQKWRNDAFEAAALIVERYSAGTELEHAAGDIRNLKRASHPNQSIADTGLSLPIGEQIENADR